ncbi:MAG: DNA polymerase I [Fusobacteriaceae bacterium]
MKRAILLDTSAIMYRAFYANSHFRTKNEPTGAVYGFVNTLLRIIADFNPQYIVAAFDVSRKSLKRTEMYSGYKAARDAAPEDLITQIPRIESLLDCFGIKRIKIEGHEADDVLGSLAKKLSGEVDEVIVITGDKDLAQIMDGNIKVALLGKGEGGEGFKVLSTPEDVIEHLGVTPDKIPDLFGLIGDTSDGIPGVRKIGVKKAVPMLEKYGNLEGIYENLDKLTELPGIGKSLINNLMEDKEMAFLSRKLATIESDLKEVQVTSSDIEYSIDRNELRKLFFQLEFKSFIKKMSLEDNESSYQEENTESIEYIPAETVVVDSKESFNVMVEEIKKNGKIFTYPSPMGICFALEEKNYYVPLYHAPLLNFNFPIEGLKEIFQQNLPIVTYDAKILYHLGLEIESKNIESDLLIANHLITSSTKDEFPLLAERYCGVKLQEYKEKFGKQEITTLSADVLGEYLGEFARSLYLSHKKIEHELEKMELTKSEEEIEIPLIEVLADMEKIGIKIDPKYFQNYSAELNGRLETISEKLYAINNGEKINLNSPKQLSQFLFLNLNLPIIKSTKTGPSTDVEVLETLSEKGYEVADLILNHRKLSKLLQTYSDPLPKLADREGRIHTTFNQIGTATGRLSSSNPNLQNIPAKTDEGMRIRRGFVAEKGKKLLGIDYSQIELRVLAELSEDKNLVKAYKENLDLHTLTAKKIFRLSEEDTVSREQRTVAKIVNFSLIYGKTAFGLSKELKISTKEASDYITAYFEQYPKVKDLEKKTIEFAEKYGYVTTYFGRKRQIDGITSKNRTIKNAAERMAVNSVIQGTASEIIKKAMVDIHKEIKKDSEIRLLLQVHDELIFEVEESVAEFWKGKMEDLMENAVKFENVKLSVNGTLGDNWAELK